VDPFVLGIEATGSGVCALLADSDGALLGVGRAAGANPTAYPLDVVSDRLAGAIISALGSTPPDKVAGAVVGMAGIRTPSEPTALTQVWERVGLTCPVRIVTDAAAAFAGGTTAARGAVLIAGAGSIAAWIDSELVTHRVAGHGWLIGDDGSGFWLGRQAVRAVLDELDGRGGPTLLRMAVLGTIANSDELPAGPDEQMTMLRTAVYDQPPIALSRLAPLVPAAAEAGDRTAQRILDRGVTLLADSLDALFHEVPATETVSGDPIVLSGELLSAPGRIQREVARRIAERYGREPVIARHAAAGAAWLALCEVNGVHPEAHAALRDLAC
jgi:N-acetylglucosamine kinase-like BadF-type ATPase